MSHSIYGCGNTPPFIALKQLDKGVSPTHVIILPSVQFSNNWGSPRSVQCPPGMTDFLTAVSTKSSWIFFKGIGKLIPIDDVSKSLHLQAHEHLDLWGNPCTPSGIYEKVKSLCSVSWLRFYSIFSKPVWAVGNQSLWISYVYPVVYAAGSPVNLSALAWASVDSPHPANTYATW